MPIEQVRHSPTCSRSDLLEFHSQSAGDRNLTLVAHEAASHLVDRHHLLDRHAGVDGRQHALVILGIELVPRLDRDHGRANLLRLMQQRAGRNAEPLGFVAGGDRAGGAGQRLHDDDRLPTQGRIILLFARCEEGIEVEEQPLGGLIGRLTCSLFVLYDRRQQCTSPARAAALRLPPRGSALLPHGPRELSRVRAKGHHPECDAPAGATELHAPRFTRKAASLPEVRGERQGLARCRIPAARLNSGIEKHGAGVWRERRPVAVDRGPRGDGPNLIKGRQAA